MAICSNRSPSPVPNRTNPNARISESSSNVRRSFSGNPFAKPSVVPNARSFYPATPANSPADSSQRNPVGKEGIAPLRASYEQKENEKDHNLKASRAKSPVVSKGVKNFMAPTISASSKIAASPRKKVLTERNEAVSTSTSFSEGISLFTTSNLPEVAEQIGLKPEMVVDFQVSSEIQKKSEGLHDLMLADSHHKEVNPGQSFYGKINDTPQSNTSSVPVADGKRTVSFMNRLEVATPPDPVPNAQVCSNTYRLPETLSETKSMNSKFAEEDLAFKDNSSCSLADDLPLLDIDPSLPPYDPKTNYLSPRPQFLHYKPNPRIEAFLNNERGFDSGDVKRLEDSFNSESCSDTENTEETQSRDLQERFEDVVSSETISEEDDEMHVSDTDPDTTREVQVTDAPKQRFFVRHKFISLFLLLAVACLSISVTDSPVLSPSMFKEQAFYKLDSPVKTAELAKTKFEGLAHYIRLWSVHSISYISKLIPTPIEVEKLGSLHFVNLTVLDWDSAVDGYQNIHFDEASQEECCLELMKEEEIEELENEIQADLEPTKEGEVEEELEEEIGTDEIISEEAVERGRKVELEEQTPIIPEAQVTETEKHGVENHSENALDVRTGEDPPSNIELEKQSALIPQAQETKPGFEENELPEENTLNSLVKTESSSVEVNPYNTKSDATHSDVIESELDETQDKFLVGNVLGIVSFILSLITATVLTYLKQVKRTFNPEAVVQVEQLPAKKLITSSVSASRDHRSPERPYFRNLPTEVEMFGESCPSDTSSFRQSSSYSQREGSKRVNEVQSRERKLRKNFNRESTASSSEYSAGSPSYGSFTTYEKIYSKNGCGEEEVVTPVRRSSRIRKQVTSSP